MCGRERVGPYPEATLQRQWKQPSWVPQNTNERQECVRLEIDLFQGQENNNAMESRYNIPPRARMKRMLYRESTVSTNAS